jgi:Leucine-rich repeat (LRR) protein
MAGRPIQRLNLYSTKITDLAPLRSMPLVWLNLAFTRVSDISALQAMPLKWLNLGNTSVGDVSTLAGMPLEELALYNTPASDLVPLRGLPLRRLNLSRCNNIRDLTPLAGCEELRDLVLPPNATGIDPAGSGINFLRRLPNLERISYRSTQQGRKWTPSQTAPASAGRGREEFWREFDEHRVTGADSGEREPDTEEADQALP